MLKEDKVSMDLLYNPIALPKAKIMGQKELKQMWKEGNSR